MGLSRWVSVVKRHMLWQLYYGENQLYLMAYGWYRLCTRPTLLKKLCYQHYYRQCDPIRRLNPRHIQSENMNFQRHTSFVWPSLIKPSLHKIVLTECNMIPVLSLCIALSWQKQFITWWSNSVKLHQIDKSPL